MAGGVRALKLEIVYSFYIFRSDLLKKLPTKIAKDVSAGQNVVEEEGVHGLHPV